MAAAKVANGLCKMAIFLGKDILREIEIRHEHVHVYTGKLLELPVLIKADN